jgi:hypothetical protein
MSRDVAGVEVVLDAERHAVERADPAPFAQRQVGRGGCRPGLVGGHRQECVGPRVRGLDPRQRRLDEFGGGQFTRPDQLGLPGRGEIQDVTHRRRAAWV